MERKCKFCGKLIPKTRRGNASYCSDDCYRKAKSTRDIMAYDKASSLTQSVKYNEHLLSLFYRLSPKIVSIPFDYLDLMGFNWGITTGETAHEGLILKVVDKYAYRINETIKTVKIWKLREQ